jgi:2-dehydro-3-deoxygluconokinase
VTIFMNRVIAFGELLLSLSAKGNQRLVQAEEFTARYTGAEANVAVSLAHFGVEAYVVSKVPAHEIGQACINALRRFGVNTEHIIRGGDRLGSLYMETGASQRPTKVIYDRAPSSFRQIRLEDIDWDATLAGKNWFHFSGTAPALGPQVVEVLTAGITTARRLGLTVSCDCNYRSKLWSLEDAGRMLTSLMPHVNLVICGKDDPQKLFGLDCGRPEEKSPEDAAEILRKRFALDTVAMTLREPLSASVNRYAAILCQRGGTCRSRCHEFQIVDRVGGGDAFAAGLIFGLLSGFEPQRTIDFAAAASCLKNSILGDFNLASREEVEQFLAGASSGHVNR